MSGASIHLETGTSIHLEPVKPADRSDVPRVLLSLEGRNIGEVTSCTLIPVTRIPALISILQLVAGQGSEP